MEMSKYELLKRLNGMNFACKCAASKSDKELARRAPFMVGRGEPIFWIRASDTYTDLQRNYLLALAAANDHRKEVPHLSSAAVYATLVDPEWCPRKNSGGGGSLLWTRMYGKCQGTLPGPVVPRPSPRLGRTRKR